ncbi:hypothetical protein [Lentibacillus salinarum]|uniref:Uncharacterized protein n=1 Tax=Lentibacillus salinarum TaxID=446820 RepID=A0ABW3ZVX3_9BACI
MEEGNLFHLINNCIKGFLAIALRGGHCVAGGNIFSPWFDKQSNY